MITSILGARTKMFTQTIKTWLHKMFAWWPWNRSAQAEYTHVPGPLNTGATQEPVSKSTIAPPASIAPRFSTIEEWPERVVQSDVPVASELGETPISPPSTSPAGAAKESKTHTDGAAVQASPSPQQRLDFLRYLVERGIVNEGLEENK